MKVTKAVIPAAGLGTRFLPATKAQPKEMLPIVDKPTIQYVVEEAVAAGIEDILIITGRSGVEDHLIIAWVESNLRPKGRAGAADAAGDIQMAIIAPEARGWGTQSCARKFVQDEPLPCSGR